MIHTATQHGLQSRPWTEVADQPVFCSFAETQAYCSWRGGGARVMREAELQRILDCPEVNMYDTAKACCGSWNHAVAHAVVLSALLLF